MNFQRILPSAYQEVEYINSWGNQYIKTGIITDITAKYEVTAVLYFFEDWIRDEAIFGTTTMEYIVNHSWLDDIRHTHYYRRNYSTGEVYITVDGSVIWNTPDNNKISEEIYLFASNHSGASQKAVYSFVSMTIKENGVLIADYVPCYRKSDGVIGLYDLVSRSFLTNDGADQFTKGADKHAPLPPQYQEVEFIQSTGYEYIDTGVCIYDYYDKLKMEVNMQITPNASQNTYCYQGVGYAGSTGYYFTIPGIYSGNNDVDFSIGNSNEGADCAATFSNAKDTKLHYMYVDAYNGEIAYNNTVRTGKQSTSISSGLGTGNVNLFAVRSYDQAARNHLKMRLYTCTMTDMSTNTKLRDFVPCYRKSDGEVGLYDLVSGTFFTNQGTGAFRKGNDVRTVKEWFIDVNGQTKTVESVTDGSGNSIWARKIPSAYQEVEYIQGNGGQYIDTGVYGGSDVSVELLLKDFKANNENVMLGAENNYNSYSYYLYLSTLYSRVSMAIAKSSFHDYRLSDSFSQREYYVGYDSKTHKLYTEDKETAERKELDCQADDTFRTNYTLYLFTQNHQNEARYWCSAKLMSCKIWYNDKEELVRDLVPCYRKSDGKVGMYDRVSGTFFTNASTGTFIKGDDV